MAFRPSAVATRPMNSEPYKVSKYLPYLYVSDNGDSQIDLLKRSSYREIGLIQQGISNPVGITLDASGNLYAANDGNGTVTEYASGSGTPSMTYSSGMLDPVDVAVDSHGNVYEADLNFVVNEYLQGSNAVIASCATSDPAAAIAVDRSNDVFVVLNGAPSTILEYAGGLQGCNPFNVGVKGVSYRGGIAIDHRGDLVVADQANASVDVLAPPFTSVSRTIGSGFEKPFSVRLNKKNTRAFVTDGITGEVTVVDYQTGQNIIVLGAPYGISTAHGAVEQANAVY